MTEHKLIFSKSEEYGFWVLGTIFHYVRELQINACHFSLVCEVQSFQPQHLPKNHFWLYNQVKCFKHKNMNRSCNNYIDKCEYIWKLK